MSVALLAEEHSKTQTVFLKNYWYYRPGSTEGEIDRQDLYHFIVDKVVERPFHNGGEYLVLKIIRLDTAEPEELSIHHEMLSEKLFARRGIADYHARRMLEVSDAATAHRVIDNALKARQRAADEALSRHRAEKARKNALTVLLARFD